MSLAGLAIGIGMMVDGAVVMVENSFRLLAHHAGKAVDRTNVILQAAREVVNPIAFAILIIIVVFLPLFSLTGLEGKLFKPMALRDHLRDGGLAAADADARAGAGVADPARQGRAGHLARPGRQAPVPAAPRLGARAQAGRHRRRRWRCSSASLALFPFLGKEFMPNLQEGAIMFRVTSIPSTSLEESIRVSERIDATLRKHFPQTKSVLATIGRAEKGETVDVNYMEVLRRREADPDEWPARMTMAALSEAMQDRISEESAHRRGRRDAADPDARRRTDLGRPRDARAQGLRSEPRDPRRPRRAAQGDPRESARRGRSLGRGEQGQAADRDQGRTAPRPLATASTPTRSSRWCGRDRRLRP